MNSNAGISGNTSTGNSGGGGVLNNGTFTMNDTADISHNTVTCTAVLNQYGMGGGGVFNNGTFTMNSGTISYNNEAVRSYGGTVAGGGGGVYNRATFTMYADGTISNNTSKCGQGGGGGVYNAGTCILFGKILDNTAVNAGGGVCNDGIVTMNGNAAIIGNTANSGGGVGNSYRGYNNSKSSVFTMNDEAVISGNTASSPYSGGGGVWNQTYGTFAMNGKAVITGNKASQGGGVYNWDTFTMNDQSAITGNTATGYADGTGAVIGGGGVYNLFGTFTMSDKDAAITGNTATSSSGGGVYNGYGAFAMAGTISDNTAGLDGGGIYTVDTSSYSDTRLSVTSGQTVSFSGNTAQYMVKPDAADWIWTSENLIDPSATSLSTTLGTAFSNYDINYALGGRVYKVTVNNDGHGSASANETLAAAGDTVQLTAVPENGYTFDSWEINADASGSVTLGNASNATFTMPANNVTETAHFKLAITTKQWTVTFVDGIGHTLKTERVKDGGAATAPNNPTRSGYVFTGWDKGFGRIISDLTVTAKWIPYWAGPPTPPPPVSPVTPTPTTTTPTATTPVVPATTTTVTPIAPVPTPQAAPIPEPTTISPTVPPFTPGNEWSLFSLMLSVAGVLIALLLLVFMPMRKRRYNAERDELEGYGLLTDDAEAELSERAKRGRIPRLLAAIIGIATFVVWLVLDWPLNNMVWINSHTVIIAILFVVCLVLTALYNVRKRDADDWDNDKEVYSK